MMFTIWMARKKWDIKLYSDRTSKEKKRPGLGVCCVSGDAAQKVTGAGAREQYGNSERCSAC